MRRSAILAAAALLFSWDSAQATDVEITLINASGRRTGEYGTIGESNVAGAFVIGHSDYGVLYGTHLDPGSYVRGYIGGAGSSVVSGKIACQYGDPYTTEDSTVFTFPASVNPTDRYYKVWYVYHTINCNGYPNPKIKDSRDRGNTPPCGGTPVWSVSEPYISLWLKDEPLGYQPPLGPRVSLLLAYDQRDSTAGYDTNLFSFGKKWNVSWLSYVNLDSSGSNVVHFPGGGASTYSGATDYLTNTRLTGDTNSGFTVAYPDGSVCVYGLIITNGSGTFQKALLTESRNQYGQSTRLNYYPYSPANIVIRLKEIVDANGATTTISYVSANSYSTNLVSGVTDPFGRSAAMLYDNSGRLTNITDVVGLSSSVAYDTNSWPTTMTTPYGPTIFSVTDAGTPDVVLNSRSVLITEPDGSHEFYRYADRAPGIAASYTLPVTSPFGNTFENSALDDHNTFHWNRKQYAALSTTNIWAFTSADYVKAQMKHWLMSDAGTLGGTLSLDRAPSQDGSIAGQITWYDYAGKTNSAYECSQASPSFVARLLPDGTTAFVRTDRNSNGFATNEVSTYTTAAGSVGLRTNTFTFAANNTDLLTATNALGICVSSNFYNSFHQVLTNFNALNEQTVYTYNATQQLESVTAPSGLVIQNNYTDGYLTQQAAVGIATNSFTWSNGLIQTRTDPRGLTVTETWDNLQRLRRLDFPDGTFITNVFDKLDLAKTVDRMGFTTSFGHNSVRQMIAATNANNVISRYGYCSCGSLQAVTNAWGATEQQVTSYSWDLQGNLLQTVAADGYYITRRYNSLGQATNILDGLTSVTNYYNNQGLLVTASNSVGRLVSIVYDVLDRSVTNTDANSVTTSSTFDFLNRLLTRGYPDGGVEKFAYSSRGLSAYTNQLNFPTLFGYDALGRKIAETNANNEVTQLTYSPGGDISTLTDGKNQITTWNFDEYGRNTNKVDAAGNIIFKFSYDPNNRLTNRWTSAKGNTVYGYDPVANLTSIQYPVSSNIALAYDSLNRLTNIVDGLGTSRYTYTSGNQLLTEDGPWDNDTVTYAYSSQLRSSLSLLQPSASPWTNTLVYDAAKRMTNITSPAGAFAYSYPASSSQYQASITLLPNGSFITNAYDSSARLLSTVLKNSGLSTLNSHSYQLNAGNQRTRQTFTAGNFTDYTYDPAGQLNTATGKEAGGSPSRFNEQFGYAYDPSGNLNWRTNNDLLQQFSVNSLNELTSISRNANMTVAGVTTTAATNVTVNSLTAVTYADHTFATTNVALVDGNNTFTAIARDSYGHCDTNSTLSFLSSSLSVIYDLNGNLRTNGTRIFDYDDENQLIRIIQPSAWKSEFAYDGRMRRRVRKEFTWASGAWQKTNETRYIYDGNLVIQERDTNNAPLVTYTRGRDLSGTLQGAGGIGGLLAFSQQSTATSQPYFYHCEGNGNITCLINSNQLVVARYTYDPYGNTLSLSGPLATANLYRFSGKEHHANSGLLSYGYRYHDPSLQRWLNRDPAAETGGLNLYAFAANGPVNGVDTDGRFPFMSAFNNSQARQLEALAASTSNPLVGAVADLEASLLRSLGNLLDPIAQAESAVQMAENTATVYQSERERCHGAASSAVTAGAYALGSYTGFTPLAEATYGNDMVTGDNLSTVDRWSRGLEGSGSLLLWAVGGFEGSFSCFPPGTKILMADGTTKDIESIQVGDTVLSQEPVEPGAPSARIVTQVHTNWTQRLIHVFVTASDNGSTLDAERDEGEILATGEHPFWTENRGWVAAKDLSRDDQLRNADGTRPVVVSAISIPTVCTTFNLSVEGPHTFFVLAGKIPVLVHNTLPGNRLYIVYQAPTANGDVYTGMASMSDPSGSLTGNDVLTYRFRGGHHRGIDFSEAEIRLEIWGGGRGSGAYDATRGAEELYDAAMRSAGRSANLNAPVDANNVNYGRYIQSAQEMGVTPPCR
jgi:RHS repeat-associated protein